jgi:hypothetical protein
MGREVIMTISEIKAANKKAGYYFFERASMRFFDSIVERYVYEGPGGIYFLTSEQFHGSNGYSEPRKWTVRQFDPTNGDVNTVGNFNKMSKEDARVTARRLARGTSVSEVSQ